MANSFCHCSARRIYKNNFFTCLPGLEINSALFQALTRVGSSVFCITFQFVIKHVNYLAIDVAARTDPGFWKTIKLNISSAPVQVSWNCTSVGSWWTWKLRAYWSWGLGQEFCNLWNNQTMIEQIVISTLLRSHPDQSIIRQMMGSQDVSMIFFLISNSNVIRLKNWGRLVTLFKNCVLVEEKSATCQLSNAWWHKQRLLPSIFPESFRVIIQSRPSANCLR